MRVVGRAALASLVLAAAALAGACGEAPQTDDWADCGSGRCDEATAVPAVHAPGLLVSRGKGKTIAPTWPKPGSPSAAPPRN